MCTVEKLLIKGIRSFSPHNEIALDFNEPLSLIVGHNGAGKTTVIECLKQATTGSMPPNSKNGQSFVHDPEIAGETEVKALIKLRIRTADRTPIVVHRSYLLTQQKTRKTFKSLDGSIQTTQPETGKLVGISNKCAEIDKLVPFLMNVSRAVLEHVVFVHQEDSLWPLSESKPLKERFDAIFAATKYTAALVKVKELIKEKTQGVKECKIHLEHQKMHREAALRLKRSLRDGTVSQHGLEQQQAQLEADISKTKPELAAVEERLKLYADKQRALDQARLKLESKQEAANDARQQLPDDFTLDDTPLAVLMEQHAEGSRKLQEKVERAKQVRMQVQKLHGDCSALQEELNRAIQAATMATAKLEDHHSRVQESGERVRELACTHSLQVPGLDAQLLDMPTRRRFLDALQGRHQSAVQGLETLHQANMDEAMQLHSKLVATKGRLDRLESDERDKAQQRQELTDRIASLEAQVRPLPMPVTLEHRRRELQEKRENSNVGNLNARVQKLEQDQQAMEHEHQRLEAEVGRLDSQLDTVEAARGLLSKQQDAEKAAADADKGVSQTVEQHASGLSRALRELQLPVPVPLDAPACLASCRPLTRSAQKQLDSKQTAHSSAQQDLHTQQSHVQTLEKQLALVQGESGQLAEDIVSTLHDTEAWLADFAAEESANKLQALQQCIHDERVPLAEKFSQMQENVVDQRASLVSDFEQAKAAGMFSKAWVKYAQERSGCKVCQRPFATTAERDAFVNRFESQQSKTKEALDGLDDDIKEVSQREQLVQGLGAKVTRHRQLHEQLPKLRQGVADANQQLSMLTRRVSETQDALATAKAQFTTAQELSTALAPLEVLVPAQAHAHSELQKARSNLAELPSSQAQDPNVLRTEVAARKEERRLVERRLRDGMQQVKQLMAQERAENEQMMAMEKEVNELELGVQRRAALQREIAGLERSSAEVEQQLQELRGSRGPLAESYLAEKREYEEFKDVCDKEERMKREQVDVLRQDIDEVSKHIGEIVSFEECGGREAAAAAQAQRGEVAAALAAKKASIDTHVKEEEKREQRIAKLEAVLSDAERSLKYGQANEDVTAASHEVQLLKEQMDGMEYEREQVELEALRNKLNDQERKRAQLEGELHGLTKSIESTRLELKQDQYKNVDEEYWKRQVEMRTLEMGNKDLKKYAVGMEKALLTYHSNKMESINQTLKELWQKTYQGQDIDYIQIKAETAETGRSSYNYRVVMLCGAAELDMRGRCSAGQKVLACILIRMALADCFCVNCGVIALDEPTTNLDVANAAALAQALRSILDMRSSLARETARAFQLIVITHDENFATQLGTREYTEFLTRVTKDEDHHSILTEEPVS